MFECVIFLSSSASCLSVSMACLEAICSRISIECVTVSRLRHRPTQSNTGTKALKRARKIQHARDVAYVVFFFLFESCHSQETHSQNICI